MPGCLVDIGVIVSWPTGPVLGIHADVVIELGQLNIRQLWQPDLHRFVEEIGKFGIVSH